MLAFIEGSMERQFVNSNFKYVRVVPVQNGITWSSERLCRQIETSFKAFDYAGEVVVWIDREGRDISAADLRNEIRATLINCGADPSKVYVLVNDRMAENLILSDESAIISEFGNDGYKYEHEGFNGKRRLRDLYLKKSVNYKEMIHGVKMLKKIRISNCAINSPSVLDFYNEFNRDCWWI